MGLPASAAGVRLSGAAAVILSLGAVVRLDRPLALAVSASYLALSAFVAAALTRNVPLQSCGCFGRQDTPPTVGHLALNVAAAVVAGVVALAPGRRGWPSVHLRAEPVVVTLFVILTASVLAFAYLALTAVPRLTVETDGIARRSQ